MFTELLTREGLSRAVHSHPWWDSIRMKGSVDGGPSRPRALTDDVRAVPCRVFLVDCFYVEYLNFGVAFSSGQ
jgi:hypothetical protein